MSNPINDIKLQFGNARALYRLMFINVCVFLVIMLTKAVIYLFQLNDGVLTEIISYFSLPSSLHQLMYQPWSLLTYMFLHEGVMHILFNMLVLYWSGKLFTEYLGNEKFWATFILGGLVGALFYILAFNLFPAFATTSDSSRLLGASAGVIAVLVAAATLLPDYTVFLFIFGPVKLKYIAIVSILLYAISIPNGNAGGEIAHLGGALFGFVMIKQLRNGKDLTSWLINLVGIFSGKRKAKMKVVSNNNRGSGFKLDFQDSTQDSIDRILDKINRSGFDSLTKDEKEVLYKASGKK